MSPSLTTNTSVWVHGPASMLLFQRVQFQHAGGYSILLDATAQTINYVDIVNCWIVNNRPTLFGTTVGQLIYGSWNGGILAMGDGRTANSSVVIGLSVTLCRFLRNTGNSLWTSLYGLNNLHQDVRLALNYFLDCGLDGILVGGVTGGNVTGNVFRRVGYICSDDTSQSTPRWLANLNATALDSSGLVKGVPYTGNSFLSINGGCLDLDGHGDSTISGNICRLPYPDEVEYMQDQIAITGPTNSGSASYGLNLGNTSNTNYGGANVNITANSFVNLPGGSIRLYGARNCHVEANNVIVPNAPINPPIAYGPIGLGPNQRANGNVIRGNRANYSPASSEPLVFEDPSITPFVSSDVNYVFANNPIIGASGLAYEFDKNVNSGSPVYLDTIWFT